MHRRSHGTRYLLSPKWEHTYRKILGTWNVPIIFTFRRHPNFFGLLIFFSWVFSRVKPYVQRETRTTWQGCSHLLLRSAMWAAKRLDCWSVITILLLAPCNNWLICHNRSKCSRFKPQCGLNLLYMPRLILHCWAVTTIISSATIAANAANSSHSVVCICCTCPGWSWTAELLLPSFHLPKAQQMQQIQTTAWSESAVHAQADLGLLSCYYHHFICQNRSKCSEFKPQCGLNLLYML